MDESTESASSVKKELDKRSSASSRSKLKISISENEIWRTMRGKKGMFSLLFRRRLEFDETARQRRDISPLELEMYKRAIRRELMDRRRHAATCATLLCILVCGSLMVSLGIALTCTGVLVPGLRHNPTPWLVTGPTCIVIGVLILLLSVEICLKKKKVAIDEVGPGRKKEPDEANFKVKSVPIWRGMDKAEVKEVQGGCNKVAAAVDSSVEPILPMTSAVSASIDLLLDPAKLEPPADKRKVKQTLN